jgi:putative addiction module antidote
MTGERIMIETKITSIGNSLGLILSKEVLARLRLDKGDRIFLIETPNGYELTPFDPEFERQMKIGGRIMKKYKNALRELAK